MIKSRHRAAWAAFLAPSLLAGCSGSEQLSWPEDKAIHDEQVGFDRDAFRDALAAKELGADAHGPRVRNLAPEPIAPAASVDPGPLVSVAVTESAPLKDVLLGLARQAERDIEIDPRIEGGIIFSAQNRPFLQVVGRIADMAGLRYRDIDGILRVEMDDPYHESYKIDMLSVARSTSSSVATSVDVVTGGGGGNGSSSSIETVAENDLWGDLEATLGQILDSAAPVRLALGSGPPQFAVGSGSAPAIGASASAERDQSGGDVITASDAPPADAALGGDLPGGGDPSENVAASDAALRAAAEMALGEEAGAVLEELTSAATTPGEGGASQIVDVGAEASSGGGDERGSSYHFNVNRAAGLISIYGAERQHRAVKAYLDRLNDTLGAQVLIEAKVLEVSLAEEFRSGINWRAVLGDLSIASPLGTLVNSGPFTDLAGVNAGTPNLLSVALEGTDFEAVANLVETFGTVRTLSSPRVAVLHNHAAILKVAENRVFFQLEVERETDDNGNVTTTTSSEISTVPVGVVITVQPSIDLDDRMISMTLRPTVTRVTDTVADPAVSIASDGDIESLVPIVAVQEIDSVVKMASGDAVVMGGLMQDTADIDDRGVPLLSELPFFGFMFKSQSDVAAQSELVIFLRATIVDPANASIPIEDVRLYHDFATDRRPWPIAEPPEKAPAADGGGERKAR